MSWLFSLACFGTVWIWLRTYNKYEYLEEERQVAHALHQKRVMKCACVLSAFAIVFMLLHFIFSSIEDEMDVQLKKATQNATLASLQGLENMEQNLEHEIGSESENGV